MVRSSNFYSRFVSWAKIILPLIALAILSSLFLFSKSIDPSLGVRLLEGDLQDFAKKERITKPRFAGMTPSGIAIELSAVEASPRLIGGPAFDAVDLSTNIEMPDGATIDIVAKRGTVDSTTNLAELTDGIILTTSYGYVAKTHGLTFSLDKVEIHSQGEITATGPIGDVTAGELHLQLEETKNPDDKPGYLLIFKNGVKLIYKP